MKKHLLLYSFVITMSFSFAQYGSLDMTFDGDGKVITYVNDGYSQCSQLFSKEDGKILLAGIGFSGTDNDFLLIQYNEDGSVDESFGDNGFVFTAIGDGNDEVLDAIMDDEGSILLAGRVSIDNILYGACVRYLPDGTLDDSFGSGGIVTYTYGDGYINQVNGIEIQEDGKIVLVGSAGDPPALDFALARLNIDGSFDTSFGTNGIVITDIGGYSDEAYAIGVTSDEKIIVLGQAKGDNISNNLAMVKYNTDGSIFTEFGTNGIVITSIGAVATYARDLIMLNDDDIIVGGFVDNDNEYNGFIASYDLEGNLVQDFGDNGIVSDDFGNWEVIWRLELQEDGKILGACYQGINMDSDFALFRYNTDGSYDDTFGDGGIVTTDFLGLDLCLALSIDGNGKILAGGYTRETSASPSTIAIARYDAGINVGLEEKEADGLLFSIYPNPATNYMIFEVESTKLKVKSSAALIKIVDVFGQEVATIALNSKKTNIDVRGFHKGIYFYTIERLGELTSGKFLVQ